MHAWHTPKELEELLRRGPRGEVSRPPGGLIIISFIQYGGTAAAAAARKQKYEHFNGYGLHSRLRCKAAA